jgi:WD40 repeat protein
VKLPAKDGAPVALAAFGGVVVCGGAKGQVVAWDLDKGTGVREVHTAAGAADAVAVGEIGGSRMVASGHADGTYQISMLDGDRVASHKAADSIIAVTLSGTPVAVSQRYDPMNDLTSVVRFWNIVTGKQIGKKFTGHYQGVNGLAFGRIEYDDVLVTGDNKGSLRLWMVKTGTLLRTFPLGLDGGIERLACGQIKGRPVVVSTHLDATLRVYDLSTGKRRGKWKFSDISPDDRYTAAVAVTDLDGVPVAAVVHRPYQGDQTVRLWNLTNGETIDEAPAGGKPLALTVAELTGRPIAVLSEESRTLRAWSLGSA